MGVLLHRWKPWREALSVAVRSKPIALLNREETGREIGGLPAAIHG